MRARKTLGNIVKLMHANEHTVDSVLSLAHSEGLHGSTFHRILQLLGLIYPVYCQYLQDTGITTFDDLIILATKYLREGKYRNPFSYIIVDEYQDIAPSRVALLRALIDSYPAKLLCVGDDWQSIYGFNGSNVDDILDFEKIMGSASVIKIEKTYRFPQDLVDILGKFVMVNPYQVRKQIRGRNNLQGSAICVLYADSRQHILEIIAQCLNKFPMNSTVFFIGRFRRDWDDLGKDCSYFETESSDIVSITYRYRPDLKIRFLTAHASKGLEADNVIIINCHKGIYGFPSQIPTHPVEALLRNQHHRFPHEEERRLFYVAATRTRNRTYLVCQKESASIFVDELVMLDRSVLLADDRFCPFCGARLIEKPQPPFGSMLECENCEKGTCSFNLPND
jgi:DNA helicase-4